METSTSEWLWRLASRREKTALGLLEPGPLPWSTSTSRTCAFCSLILTENNLTQYADLTARIAEIQTESEQAAEALKGVERRLADMAVLMKHVATYQKTKPAYDAYRRAKDKGAYRAKQESSLILHEAAAKTLKASGITKLPNLAAMQEEYGQLQAQKEALYADYGKLKKKVKEYDVIKQNIDSILRQGKEPERGKETERG